MTQCIITVRKVLQSSCRKSSTAWGYRLHFL